MCSEILLGGPGDRRGNRSIEHAQFQALTRSGTHARACASAPFFETVRFGRVGQLNGLVTTLGRSTSAAFRGSGAWRPTTRTISRGRAVLLRRSGRSARRGRRRSPARRRTRRRRARDRRGHRRLSSGAAARRRGASTPARQLADPQTVAVVTGQQAGLFGGPLFTLLKALTALKLAAQVTREHQVPRVAVFWIDAEDHDWDEVRACHGVRRGAEPAGRRAAAAQAGRATRRSRPSGSTSRSPRRSTSSNATLPATEFKAVAARRAAVARTRRAPAWPRRSARWLERVLGDRGLVVYDASDPAAKPLACDAVRARAVDAGRNGAAGRRGRRRSRGARLPLAGQRAATTASRCSTSTAAAAPIRQQDGAFVVGEQPFDAADARREGRRPSRRRSARTCCCGRSSRTRCFRRSATWPGRTSWPTSASCAASTSTSACRCR